MAPPPRLRWGWVLAFSCLTGGWFGGFWFLRQAKWSRAVRGASNAYAWAIIYLVFLTIDLPFTIVQLANIAHMHVILPTGAPNGDFLAGAMCILYPVVGFALQSEFEEAPIHLNLSGWMVFFWGPVYLQFWLDRLGKHPAAKDALAAPFSEV